MTINITDIVQYKDTKYRVDFFKKKIYSELHLQELYDEDDIIGNIVWEGAREEYLERLENGLPTKKFKFIHCNKEEATHVQLYGLTYPIARIEECSFVEKISWPQKLIHSQIEQAQRYVDLGTEYSMFTRWEWE
jgi:hypothetical protein